ncbi:MAG: flagellar FlbD family protein [Leptospirales bacterium]
MIEVTRLNGDKYLLNQNLIEVIEQKPDTIIKLSNDKNLIVKETPTEIINRIIKFKREIYFENNRVE